MERIFEHNTPNPVKIRSNLDSKSKHTSTYLCLLNLSENKHFGYWRMSQNLTCYSENGNSSCANLLRPAIFCEWRYFVSRKIQAHFSATPSLACFVNKTGTLPCFTVARLLRALH